MMRTARRTMGLTGATLALLVATGCGSSSQTAADGTGGAGNGGQIARSGLAHDDNPQVTDSDYRR